MPHDVLFHINKRLNTDTQNRLIALITERYRIAAAVRELGYHAQVVDL